VESGAFSVGTKRPFGLKLAGPEPLSRSSVQKTNGFFCVNSLSRSIESFGPTLAHPKFPYYPFF
jgi:hypothetical protein